MFGEIVVLHSGPVLASRMSALHAAGIRVAPHVALLGQNVPQAAGYLNGWLPWIVAAAIVVLGLGIYGFKDLSRLNWRRVWAISSVCSTESLRRRVLWVTPLAIIGVIVVSQFQQAATPQDAMRQTTKFCLFASGLLVIVTAIILACTNLPREIESRVIYTIVTKPTTRLEIVLGKVVGFARISGLIIILMGIFTAIYLKVRSGPMIAAIRSQLASEPANSPLRPSLEYFAHAGLLETRSLEWPGDLQFYSRPPGASPVKWMFGGESEYFLLPFNLNAEQRDMLSQLLQLADEGKPVPLYLKATMDVVQHEPNTEEKQLIRQMGLDRRTMRGARHSPVFGPVLPTTAPATRPGDELPPADLTIQILDQTHHAFNSPDNPGGVTETLTLDKPRAGTGRGPWTGEVEVPLEVIRQMVEKRVFYAQVSATSPATEYGSGPMPVVFQTPLPGIPPILPAADPTDLAHGALPQFLSFPSRQGMRLSAVHPGSKGPLAVYSFRGLSIPSHSNGAIGLQVSVAIDRTGEFDVGTDYSKATVQVVNLKTGQRSPEIPFSPETSRAQPVPVDIKYLRGGNFDVLVRNVTKGQWLGMTGGEEGSVALVTGAQSFALNLVKSLFILWLLSLMVVIMSVFCSTFLSWPIAVVLTLLLLLGHWGVDQLRDSLKPGFGRSVPTEFGIRDPGATQVISTGVDAMGTMLRTVSAVLPDVSKFAVMEDIDRGVSIPAARMGEALAVLFCYGVPLLVLSYIILRRKEVAP